jgi:vacuolar-type H+-ATPase subunit F/Vma7
MSDIVVIVPAEMAAAFRLARVMVLPARTPAEAWQQVQDVQGHPEAKVVILPEHFLSGVGPNEYRQIMASDQPYFIPLPMDWQTTRDARESFQFQLGRILGCLINLTDQVLRRGREVRRP